MSSVALSTIVLTFACASLTMLGEPCHAETIVFTNQANPVFNSGSAKIVFVDAVEALEAQISEGLPADPSQAAAEAKRRIEGPSGRRFINGMRDAQQGVADAWSLQVEKLPAVVVDRAYVTYGISDVGAAEELIASSREAPKP
ncbi:hypothetical protein ALO95_200039 [Pseudomonas syringae pv. antirrhini]|uniref:TIGR03757 family integrating conjugative element protein n=1 Tax=Pseudomonas syringae group genomosp. 3 TaxID=251701 RepID=UPI000F3D0C43|nr:TIGR03757 family integrating conjugative element protein [Pseudomonas syringae group genomosp. 3]RMP45659.1 hypothetical protein ALQ23_200440 [Pseudomonas syringae pv. antirrhini]RMW25657.1 hypothetical protein ALO95_200039 [Pseudomonas syringae pv. antirrhini]